MAENVLYQFYVWWLLVIQHFQLQLLLSDEPTPAKKQASDDALPTVENAKQDRLFQTLWRQIIPKAR